jgi:Domain of unknown function (DUF4149)
MNGLHLTTGVAYALGMALVFGGTAALSFASAPATFRTLKPVDAGRVFGKTLRVFDAMAFWASLIALAAAAVDTVFSGGPVPLVRTVLSATVAALLLLARRRLSPRMAALKPPETEDEDRRWEPERRAAFNRLHAQYVRVYAANLFLSLGGLTVQALAR